MSASGVQSVGLRRFLINSLLFSSKTKFNFCTCVCAKQQTNVGVKPTKIKVTENIEDLREKHGFGRRNFEDLTIDKYRDLITDESMKTKIELILSEYEYHKHTNMKVPSTISVDYMKRLIEERDAISRQSVLRFLYTKEMAKINDKVKKKEKAELRSTWIRTGYDKTQPRTGIFDNNGNICHGLWHNTMFEKMTKSDVRRINSLRHRTTCLFGQKLVIDLDFDRLMTLRECRMMLKQIGLLYSYNRYQAKLPFDLHFCNVNRETQSMLNIGSFVTNYQASNSFLNFHPQSYLDIFARKNLIYLTPCASACLEKYDPDDIYIVGGIVGKHNYGPVTCAKAQQEGLRTARLPIDEHVACKSSVKNLCLNHVHLILHDWALTKDWPTALRNNIPRRRQKDERHLEFEEALKLKNIKKQLVKLKTQ